MRAESMIQDRAEGTRRIIWQTRTFYDIQFETGKVTPQGRILSVQPRERENF